MTPPAYWGGPKGTSGHNSKTINPGFLWKVEKLSFRAGVMIRPFSMDDDDFRRGKLSTHKKFDEPTAMLAGNSLLTFAYEILSSKKLSCLQALVSV